MKAKNYIKYIFPILLMLTLSFPIVSLAITLNLDYPTVQGFNPKDDQGLNQIIAWFYYFIVMVSGLATFVMLVWGGVQWMSSAGNPTAIGDAKDRIQKALLGLLIILSSYLIIQVINPELVTLVSP